jgi:CHAT domain-containing protein/tetratricopeptide (TPR) repeat protein
MMAGEAGPVDPVEALVERLADQVRSPESAALAPQDLQLILDFPVTDQLEVFNGLKAHADRWMRAEQQRCLGLCAYMQLLAEATGRPEHMAVTLRARGNAYAIGQADFLPGLQAYDRAAEIYAALGDPVRQAESLIGKLYALMNLGRYEQAFAEGEWAREVLRSHGEWLTLARLKTNLALLHSRLGRDAEALELLDLARQAYLQLGVEGEAYWPRVEVNRATVLRNLGRYEEAIQACQEADRMFRQMGQEVSSALARQGLAVTYYVMGRYNDALVLLEQAREVFIQDGRQRRTAMVDLFISDCLLELRRFPAVVEKCQQARDLFLEIGSRYEAGQALINAARAQRGLRQHDPALATLDQARALFSADEHQAAATDADLLAAEVYLDLSKYDRALALAGSSLAGYASREQPLGQARACQVAARAALGAGNENQAHEYLRSLRDLAARFQLPGLEYQGHQLAAELALQHQELETALDSFEKAIQALERLAGDLMVEHRASFIEDKTGLYEDAVAVCLRQSLPARGLEFAERAKSRALLDLLAHRVDLRLKARDPQDQSLVDELVERRSQRNRLIRRWAAGEGLGQRGAEEVFVQPAAAQQQLLDLEQRITELWHQLLMRNASYAQEAALWQVHVEPVQPFLEPGTTLVEYFKVGERLVVFVVTGTQVQAVELTAQLADVDRLIQLLWLNLRSVARLPVEHQPALEVNLRGVLRQLHAALFAPLERLLPDMGSLMVVPHGALHYLPLHALHDGERYLLERYDLSYLPMASLLRYCLQERVPGGSAVVFGHSYQGALPYTLAEARQVAELWGCQATLEADATLERFYRQASAARLLHLAAHGDFRGDNPLFSGLALEDGWVTTLDIFNQQLQAELVTLSACQTGRSVVGGGDELQGLMRAFLAAGAASLLVTLWAVDDQSTAVLMERFYHGLADGQPRRTALQQAQLHLLQDESLPERYRHPYYWAPFFLVGKPGPLTSGGQHA